MLPLVCTCAFYIAWWHGVCPVIYKVNKHGFFLWSTLWLCFTLNNFQYSVCKVYILFCVHIRLLVCVVFLSCRATALQTVIECKLLQKLDVINTVHDAVCVCACARACAPQSSCWSTLHFCVNIKSETVLSVSEQLSWKKVNSSKCSKVELTFMKVYWRELSFHLPFVLGRDLYLWMHQNHQRSCDFRCGLTVKVDHLMRNSHRIYVE